MGIKTVCPFPATKTFSLYKHTMITASTKKYQLLSSMVFTTLKEYVTSVTSSKSVILLLLIAQRLSVMEGVMMLIKVFLKMVVCNGATCGYSYRILRSEHDNCGHDTMSATSAKGLHSFEEVCAVENCNSLATDEEVADQLVCHDHDEHDHDEHDHEEEETVAMGSDSAGVASQVSGLFAILLGIAFLAIS